MELNEIKSNWVNKNYDSKANLAAWDSMAERYKREVALPDWESDPFLLQLSKEVDFSEKMSVLDIGCGTGGYAAALAKKAGHITGTDISFQMLIRAKSLIESLNIENVEFICTDFCEFELDKKFDLVFAHLTPAVSSAETFEKMLSLASNYCYLVKPVHRTDPVSEAVKKAAGLNGKPSNFDKELYYAFSMLWQKGLLPSLSYYKTQWKMEKTIDEAVAWYINRIKNQIKMDSASEKKAISYLESISVDGKVYETISTTVATMGWQMQGRK